MVWINDLVYVGCCCLVYYPESFSYLGVVSVMFTVEPGLDLAFGVARVFDNGLNFQPGDFDVVQSNSVTTLPQMA